MIPLNLFLAFLIDSSDADEGRSAKDGQDPLSLHMQLSQVPMWPGFKPVNLKSWITSKLLGSIEKVMSQKLTFVYRKF